MKVEPGSSIEDSQGDQSNMAGFYTNSAELRSLLECFSGSVPKTAHYQDSVRDGILPFMRIL